MQLRLAKPEDALAVARVHVRSWQLAYRGLLPGAALDRLRPEDRAQRYDFHAAAGKPETIVAEQAGVIVGFATVAPSRDGDADGKGELCALYVEPLWWGHGVGRALLEQARSRLLQHGFGAAVLWVLVGNARAERLYVRDGWSLEGARRTASIGGIAVEQIRYERQLAEPR